MQPGPRRARRRSPPARPRPRRRGAGAPRRATRCGAPGSPSPARAGPRPASRGTPRPRPRARSRRRPRSRPRRCPACPAPRRAACRRRRPRPAGAQAGGRGRACRPRRSRPPRGRAQGRRRAGRARRGAGRPRCGRRRLPERGGGGWGGACERWSDRGRVRFDIVVLLVEERKKTLLPLPLRRLTLPLSVCRSLRPAWRSPRRAWSAASTGRSSAAPSPGGVWVV